jgi:hypothetical protein
MSDSDYREALAVLRDGPVPLGGGAEVALQRQKILPLVVAEVRRTPERLRRRHAVRRVTQIGAVTGGLALAATMALFVGRPSEDAGVIASDSVRVDRLGMAKLGWTDMNEVTRELSGETMVPARGVLTASDVSGARVTTAGGVEVELAERTQVDLGALAKEPSRSTLRLVRGAVRCHVPKLQKGQHFSVVTPDVEVVVHGTVFSVRASEDEKSTCVRVEEGLVGVTHNGKTVNLGPGTSWGCGFGDAASDPSARVETFADLKPAPGERSAPGGGSAVKARGTLDQENRLLKAALSAERNGSPERARALFSELLSRYPSSPLVPEARAGLGRLAN